jgi:hypothetical protein
VCLENRNRTKDPESWAHGPGVNVVIAIFGDFDQFSPEIVAIFQKNNVMIIFGE